MTKTVIFHNAPEAQLAQVVGDLEADEFNVSKQREEDGEFTVIGTKEIPDPVPPKAPAKSSSPRSRKGPAK